MKYSNWLTCCVLLFIAVELASSDEEELDLNERYPDRDETDVCGNIRDVIQRDSGRFRRILIRNTNDQAQYADEDARRMTSRTKSKLDVLASLVRNEDDWDDQIKVRVIRAWTDQVENSDPTSLHYEGM